MTELVFNDDDKVEIIRLKKTLESHLETVGAFKTHTFERFGGINKRLIESINAANLGDVVVAGGVMGSILRNEKYKDIDIFILNSNLNLFNSLINEKEGSWVFRFRNPVVNNKTDKDDSILLNVRIENILGAGIHPVHSQPLHRHLVTTNTTAGATPSVNPTNQTQPPVYIAEDDGDVDSDDYIVANPHVLRTAFNKATKIQYILTDYKSRLDLLNDFDYLHCTISYVPKTCNLFIKHDSFHAAKYRHLVRNNLQRDVNPKRKDKFLSASWTEFDAESYRRFLEAGMTKSITDSLYETLKKNVDDAIKNRVEIGSNPYW